MEDANANTPVLISMRQDIPTVPVNSSEFVIGRAVNASYDIKNLAISRTHCIISLKDSWTIRDKSSSGTWLNGNRLEANTEVTIRDGDALKLGDGCDFIFLFCTGGPDCSKCCYSKKHPIGVGLDVEFDQRRRSFEFHASCQKDGMRENILRSQRKQKSLQEKGRQLTLNHTIDLSVLEEKLIKQQKALEESSNVSDKKLSEERQRLEDEFKQERVKLKELHDKSKAELESNMQISIEAEKELALKNQELLDRLDHEKQLFEKRLEEEKKILEAKFAEQLAEQQKLAVEKVEVEEALRNRIQNLEQVAHHNGERQEIMRAECQKEKTELEKRLQEVQLKLIAKEETEKKREEEIQERDRQLRTQEEQREKECRERAAELRAKEEEWKERQHEIERELKKREEEVARERLEREAELKRQAEIHEAQRLKEQGRLQEEISRREQEVRQQLESEISKLQNEKILIELNIQGELEKKDGENAETLQTLSTELQSVKRDLATTSTKRSLLERELQEVSQAKEAASRSSLEARKDIIDNFGKLVETELQCSICNELFVVATTLNCNHTYCQECISSWLVKQKSCPVCRAPVVQQSRSLVLDNFIDRMVENLSEDLKTRRKELVEERKGSAPSAAKKMRIEQRVGQTVQVSRHVLNANAINLPRIVNLMPVATPPPGTPVIRIRPTTSVAGVLNESAIDLTANDGSFAAVALSAAEAAAIANASLSVEPPILISSDSDDSEPPPPPRHAARRQRRHRTHGHSYTRPYPGT